MTYLLERTPVYSLWQAPFAAEKLAPVLTHNEMTRVRRVLDIGCGPGTNTDFFRGSDYLGVDINPNYIQSARRKHKRAFVVADVTTYADNTVGTFDFILVNSFLHHLNDSDTEKVLSRLATWLTPDGQVHILELVLPGKRSAARLLANWDRGKYARPLENWRRLFEKHFDIVLLEPYSIKRAALTLWNMVYCKGQVK